MKQKIMINAGVQCFEFEGEIVELEDDYLILKAKHGDIFIERKYLVFIQFLEEEKEEVKPLEKNTKHDAAAKFVNTRLKHDPVDRMLEEKFIPPSQLPDGAFDDDDDEVARNVYGAVHTETPITKANNLKDAVKVAMQNPDNDFSMGGSGGKYQDPTQTILRMKNAHNKKS